MIDIYKDFRDTMSCVRYLPKVRGIYLGQHVLTHMAYIGKDWKGCRPHTHMGDIIQGRKGTRWQPDIKRYGVDDVLQWTIIRPMPGATRLELEIAEWELMRDFIATFGRDRLYNEVLPKRDSLRGWTWDDEQRAKMSEIGQRVAQDPEWQRKNKEANQRRSQDPEWQRKNKESRHRPISRLSNARNAWTLHGTPNARATVIARLHDLADAIADGRQDPAELKPWVFELAAEVGVTLAGKTPSSAG